MFDDVDTPFSYGRGFIVCLSLQELCKTKESTLHMISYDLKCRYCVFTLCGRIVLTPPCFGHDDVIII